MLKASDGTIHKKQIITDRFGNPEEEVKNQGAAEEFFLDWTCQNNRVNQMN